MCGAVNGGVNVSWFGAWFGPRMWGIWVCRDGGSGRGCVVNVSWFGPWLRCECVVVWAVVASWMCRGLSRGCVVNVSWFGP